MAHSRDRYVTAVTEDRAFRVIAAQTSDTARTAASRQQESGPTATRLGELVTGTILVRVAMAPQMRVQAILRGADESGQIVADSAPEGWARGLVRHREGETGDVEIGGNAVLQMIRSLPNGELQRSLVEVSSDGGVSAALTTYMAHSEQVVSTVGVACVLADDGGVGHACGYLVEVLPEIPEGPLATMTERLAYDFADLGQLVRRRGPSPEVLLEELLYGMPYEQTDEGELRFGCHCSDVRVMTSLSTLPRSDLEELINAEEMLEMRCEYCGQQYNVDPARLRGLLERS